MSQRGDWVVPWFNDQSLYDKPPLIYWFQIIAYRLLRENEFAARLPSVLASSLTAVAADLGALWGCPRCCGPGANSGPWAWGDMFSRDPSTRWKAMELGTLSAMPKSSSSAGCCRCSPCFPACGRSCPTTRCRLFPLLGLVTTLAWQRAGGLERIARRYVGGMVAVRLIHGPRGVCAGGAAPPVSGSGP